VCNKCQSKYEIGWGDSIMQKVYEKGFRDGQQDILVSDNAYNVTVKVSRSELRELFSEVFHEMIGDFIFPLNEKLKIICGHCIMDLVDSPVSPQYRCRTAEKNCENCISAWLSELSADEA
ncbi:MAG: hypothetical protein IKP69_11015, partial [Oscillospiraceae bacterium]|nr:hypothetical protein [Oscillospiraceae bacterium]